ncbi:hypothetical protein NG895_03775 [Aeoliella sp. ICT_H6.2]|uniref:Uncharacterized protein n=1 Tax=Aeoliella straminimaris TaxID=2954799 RepID=A0A9X2JF80_9BACT|nr:hypothetical protein [Aeoliella straminimaris]MCO6043017.1 hypothetical protein [Aeoliella straminimaris]
MRSPLSICLVALVTVVGCGKGEAPKPTAAGGANAPGTPAATEGTNQIHPSAMAAKRFLEVSAAGNEASAKSLLTPLAVEQLEKSGQRLACLGDDSAKFQVTRWLVPQEDEAAVEFRMQFSMEGKAQHIDGCCLMKSVQGSWRVAGVALDPGDGSGPVVVNYEEDLTQVASEANPAGTVQNQAAAGEVPQTAQNPNSAQNR